MTEALLPQNDENQSNRQKSLDKGRKIYKYKYNYPALCGVPMADGMPWRELPTLKWIWKFIKTFFKLLINLALNFTITSAVYYAIKRVLSKFLPFSLSGREERPSNIQDYGHYFKYIDLPIVAANYQEDGVFGRMRVAGQNPVVIKRVTALDETFPVTEAMFQSVPGFEDDTLEQAGADKRLYLADYVDIELIRNGRTNNVPKFIYVPKALFAIPAQHDGNVKTALLPIAIQCRQNPNETDNPIFTPKDGVAWEMAKTTVQIADFNYHELITHLGATHLVIEPFVVTTHRQLAANHPVKRLLLPHFEGTILINWGAQASLVADGGPFDEMFAGTMHSNRKIVGQTIARPFNDEMFPHKTKQRGVDDEKLFYPYRDDAASIWQATFEWVSDYLDVYYKNDQDVTDDTELKAWVHELVEDGGVQGFGNDSSGVITTLAYLKEAVTMVIFTASTQHSAVNFTQKDFSAYAPNMPASGYTEPPANTKQDEQDYLNMLPPLNIANDQVNLTNLLSGIEYTRLGYYDTGLFTDDTVVAALDKFKAKLGEIEKTILTRNEAASHAGVTPYRYMLPSRIPQSINI